MKRLGFLGVTLATAMAVAVPHADAGLFKKKKKSFFESLFGSLEGNSRDRKFRNPPPPEDWWQLPDDNGGVRIIRGAKDKRAKNGSSAGKKSAAKKAAALAPAALIDPEEAEGFGFGNLTYQLPAMAAVSDPTVAKIEAPDTASAAIKAVLADRGTAIKATADIRKSVLTFYKATQFKPLWTAGGKLTTRGQALLKTFANAGAEGLEPGRYMPAALTSFENPDEQILADPLAVASLDVGLTVAALTYAKHISGGQFEPERLSKYHDIKPDYVNPDIAMKVIAFSPFPDSYLKGLAPTHPAYAQMKQALAQLAAPEPREVIAEGKRVKVGQKDARIRLLREKLAADGFEPKNAAEITEESIETLDKHLSKALKAYQEARAIPQTGVLDQITTKTLNGGSPEEQRDKLVINMERLRWLPRDLGSRHVFVNQAAYSVVVKEDGKNIWTSKVIVGRPTTQTSVFSDQMETVVFNPTWGMPQSILLNEYLPKLRRDPSYLDRKGFQVVNAKGQVVSSRSINWHGVGSGNSLGVVQPAGSDNALGEVKFLFPNTHSIYMHDTPNRELFSREARNFSHGCVRVENPREFAQVLLRWDAAKVDEKIDGGATNSVKVTEPTRVHLTYFTAWPDDSGQMKYFSDAYQRDKTLVDGLAVVHKVFGKETGTQLVENAKITGQLSSD